MKTKKFISLIITLIMVCSIITVLPINASAAYSAVQMNVSSEPCYANLSTADYLHIKFLPKEILIISTWQVQLTSSLLVLNFISKHRDRTPFPAFMTTIPADILGG